MNPRKLLKRISSGDVRNVSFSDVVKLVERLGFEQAKPYQIRQLLKLIERYNLKLMRDS